MNFSTFPLTQDQLALAPSRQIPRWDPAAVRRRPPTDNNQPPQPRQHHQPPQPPPYDPFHPARRPPAGNNQIPPYPSGPAGRPYEHFHPQYFPYNPNAPLRVNPHARLPPRPQWPRGNPPPPPIDPFLEQQIRLSQEPFRPPISNLFDDVKGPFLHHRVRNLCTFADNLITALPYLLAAPIIYPLYFLIVIPLTIAHHRVEDVLQNVAEWKKVDWDNFAKAAKDVVWVFGVIDQFLDKVVLKTLVFLVLKPLSQIRNFIRDRLRMREVWCFIIAFLFVRIFWHRPIVVERVDEDKWNLRYILIPQFKRWAADNLLQPREQ